MSEDTERHDILRGVLEPIPVLDHGFLRVVDVMPRYVEEGETGDHAIASAARVSYQKGTTRKRGDRGLIRYLMRHRHTSPFEMVELKFHAKMPIFVARQWVRHRTASINEVSARYSVLSEESYLPELDRIQPQSKTNRQGSADEALPEEVAARVRQEIAAQSEHAFGTYREHLDRDVARELARGVLPVNAYTEWYWKANLLNVLRFLGLRLDSHAQYEIRVYAEAMAQIVERVAPWTWEAFVDYWLESRSLSGPVWRALQQALNAEQREQLLGSLEGVVSKGELREITAMFAEASAETDDR